MAQQGDSEGRETGEKFYRFFQSEATALQQHIDRLGDTALVGGERTDATEYCMAGIQRLSDEVKSASVYLPARDQKTYLESLKSLTTRLQETRDAHAPKPKFSFKSAKRPSAMSLADAAPADLKVPGYGISGFASSNESSKAPTPARVGTPPNEVYEARGNPGVGRKAKQDDDLDLDDEDDEDVDVDREALARKEAMIRKMSFSQAQSVLISRQSHSHIILPPSAAHATTTGTLSNLRRCVVDMSAPTGSKGRPFAGLTLKNIKQSLVICGRVAGALHVTNLKDSVIVVACRQFRMHECKGCDVYLQVGSRPIIEDCDGIRFAPEPVCYKAELQVETAENQWDQVDDFKWLKSEPSPNWKTMPTEERVGEEVWTKTVLGEPGVRVSEILEAVGVGKA